MHEGYYLFLGRPESRTLILDLDAELETRGFIVLSWNREKHIKIFKLRKKQVKKLYMQFQQERKEEEIK